MSKLKNIKSISGAGGGGKSGGGSARAPVEAPDTLRSIQYAKIIDLISEGEIHGCLNGLKSIYLNNTPIQNEDGSYNFKNVIWDERVGTQSQSRISGFDGAESEVTVGAEIKKDTPVVRSISNSNANAIRVTVGVPNLTEVDDETGDINGTSVKIGIDLQNNGGGFFAQEIRKIFTTSGFVITKTGAYSSIESARYLIDVSWQVASSGSAQSCTFELQYRLIGSSTWLTYVSYTFSRKSGDVSSQSSIQSIVNQQNYEKNKTFDLTLANGAYEFRVVKTAGTQSQDALGFAYSVLKGVKYGGSVSIVSGQTYQPDYMDVISGKCTSKYQRSYRINLPAPGPWDIKIRRVTNDSTSSLLSNKTFFDSYTEIIDARLSYPNSAIEAIQIDASQFSSVPSRAYLAKGLLVKIPSNYDPITREYSGVWNGTFTVAWTDNPAWCFYDFVTNARYGLGEFIDETQVDKWSLYSIAQYCDEMVPNGYGGFEPRFTCSLYLQTQEEAYTVINNMASIFRGMVYWSSSSITTSQDSPKDASMLFTAANIIDGIFNYSGSSGRVRHTVALVAWNDPADGYTQKIEYVEDADAISRYGVVQTDIVAFGCTSRGQAHRMGKWLLYTEQYETETVSFKAALDSVYIAPGDIIKTHDSNRVGARFGGRLISATTTTLTLDSPITVSSGETYSVSVVLPDGQIEVRNITNSAGSHSLLNLSTALSAAPLQHSIWLVSASNAVNELWRVVSIQEAGPMELEVTALSYRADKYDAIEQNLTLDPIPISLIESGNPQKPANLTISEALYLSGLGTVAVKALVSWDIQPEAASYTLTYQAENSAPIIIAGIQNNSIEILPISEGVYEFKLVAVNALGRQSLTNTVNATIYGKRTPPANVQNFSLIKSSGIAIASWLQHPDLDVTVGGNIVVRFSPLESGASWEKGIVLDVFPGNAISGVLPLMTGTYMAKAIDSSGNWSVSAVSFVATEGMVTGFVTVDSLIEQPIFAGVKSNVAAIDSALLLTSTETVVSMPGFISTWPKLSALGGINASGEYLFSDVMDLTTSGTRRFESKIDALSFDTQDFISQRQLVSTWASITGSVINDCDATLYISTTDDNPSGSPTWGDYTPFFVGDFTCRAARFKLQLTTLTPTHNIKINALEVRAKIPV